MYNFMKNLVIATTILFKIPVIGKCGYVISCRANLCVENVDCMVINVSVWK